MNETIDASDTVVASTQAEGPPLDVHVLPMPTPVADRSMLVVQYGSAVIAAACALLLSQAS